MVAHLLKIMPHASEANRSGELPPPEFLDPESCRVYSDPEGLHLLRTIIPAEEGMLLTGTDSPGNAKPKVLLGLDGRPAHTADLVSAATAHYYQRMADATGRKTQCKFRDRDGQLVTLDLSPTDVHQPAVISNYAAGYRIADGIADIMSPVMPVAKQSDYYGTWNVSSDFSRKMANVGAVGGQVQEVNPGLTFSQYSATPYALGGALPTEVLQNADAPFRPLPKLMQVIVDALRLEREIRVANQMTTSGNWTSALVQTLLSGANWDEGAASNPLLNLHAAIDASYKPVTGIGVSGQLWRAFVRNASVQKFFAAKVNVDGIPTPEVVADKLKLPPFYIAEMKYTVNGALSFVWGTSCVLIHQPGEMPPTSQMDVATAMSFRWIGGAVPPDGSLSAGLLVRSYFDQKRGPRGSTVVVCTHNDIELMTSGYVGGLILNAHS